MQTFIPLGDDFKGIASLLDDKRVNKQISEARTLIHINEGLVDSRWKNHPACKMWYGYTNCLRYYHNCFLYEWMEVREKNRDGVYYEVTHPIDYPDFLHDERVLLSHKSNLARKRPDLFPNWKDYGVEGYYWPCEVKASRTKKINKFWDEIVRRGE